MSQSRAMSGIEAVVSVIVGYAVAILGQMAILPIFGLAVSVADTLRTGVPFTLLSLTWRYALHRLFNALDGRRSGATP